MDGSHYCLIIVCFAYHKYKLKEEEELREPLGQLIDINGNKMSIYVEGSGYKTLVFLSGGGTCSPIVESAEEIDKAEHKKYILKVIGKFSQTAHNG